jgi:glycosyltransferase involved in cell wall biosynthesis
MSDTLISVIVPAFQREQHLGATLSSIIAQSYSPLEIIVVDDGSTDKTATVAQSYRQVRYVFQSNQGPPAARNTGLANCNGGLIAFLDADDLWPADKLEKQFKFLTTHPEIACVLGRMKNFLDDGIDLPNWVPVSAMSDDSDALSLGAGLIRREAFDRIGGFDANCWFGDDLDWFIRLREAELPMAVMKEVFLLRRIHSSNISRNQKALTQQYLRIIKAHIDRRRKLLRTPAPQKGQP